MPKLLDFGLAAMLDRSHGGEAPPVLLPADPEALAARFHGVLASSTLTITHQVVGTPLYLSPEALDGAPAHESFDLWSLGARALRGHRRAHPLAGRSVPEVVQAVRHTPLPDIRALRPDVPVPVAAFLADALSPAIDRRPASAAHLRMALRELRARLTPDS